MGSKPLIAAVFASGNGSNAENIIRFAKDHADRLRIAVLICNNPEAHVIERARALGIACDVVPKTKDRRDQEEKIVSILRQHNVEWIFLAGYMQILSPWFLSQMKKNHVVNIHPSLLPQFPGRDAYGDAFQAGVDFSGVTLHFVDEGVDTGPMIIQKKFPRLEGDTLETFRARGMALEYDIYREFLSQLIQEAVA